jgi:hypothetical protein
MFVEAIEKILQVYCTTAAVGKLRPTDVLGLFGMRSKKQDFWG